METAFDIGDKYIFAMIPDSIKNPDDCTDPFFSVDKKHGAVEEWNIFMNLDAYNKAVKKPFLYKRSK